MIATSPSHSIAEAHSMAGSTEGGDTCAVVSECWARRNRALAIPPPFGDDAYAYLEHIHTCVFYTWEIEFFV